MFIHTKARVFRISALALVLVVGVFAFWCRLDREQEYHGQPLSYWLDQALTGELRDGLLETGNAFKTIGAPAAAALVPAMTLNDSPLRHYYTGLRSKLPASLNAILPHERLSARDARYNAGSMLRFMGPAASTEIPELIRLLKHPDKQVRIDAIIVLHCIGPDARPAIPTLLEVSRDSDLSAHVAAALKQIEGKAQTEIGK